MIECPIIEAVSLPLCKAFLLGVRNLTNEGVCLILLVNPRSLSLRPSEVLASSGEQTVTPVPVPMPCIEALFRSQTECRRIQVPPEPSTVPSTALRVIC